MLLVNQLNGFGVRQRGGNDAFTKVLLHFDGVDAATTIADSNAGGSTHTWTAQADAQLDTAIVKFGTAAGLFDGTGDFFSTPDHAEYTLGAGDFTVDFWFNRSGGDGTNRNACGQNSSGGGDNSFFMGMSTANVFRGGATSDGTNSTLVTGTTAITTTGWHHVALVRTGNILKLFLDGVQEGGDVAFAATVWDSASVLGVGGSGAFNNFRWLGSIDEFRLSVGIARWTANFTPPTAPYS